MTHKNWLMILAIIFGLIALSLFNAIDCRSQTQQEKNDVSFQFAFGSIRKQGAESRFETIKGDSALNTGEYIKFFMVLFHGEWVS